MRTESAARTLAGSYGKRGHFPYFRPPSSADEGKQPMACSSRLAASTAGRHGRRLVMDDGWLAKDVCGRFPASVGPVEVGVEADESQVVFLRGDVRLERSED